ncbi:M24 family metallopeptidase, partial [Saccharothrix sp. MB29]|nr:M24 family metallopeptidase [Saccharothrix sp. MB29]
QERHGHLREVGRQGGQVAARPRLPGVDHAGVELLQVEAAVRVGAVSDAELKLSEATRRSMEAGIAAAVPGNKLSDISFAIESATILAGEEHGIEYGIVDGYGGHGIGTKMHMDPFLPNHGKPGKGPRLKVGMAIAIEPMLTLGSESTVELDDGWTVVTAPTADGARAAHWPHSDAITAHGPWVLTAPDEG